MIIKLREGLHGETYQRKSRTVQAIRMTEDSLYETLQGWVKAHKGQWLVELGEDLRCSLDNEAFMRTYQPAKEPKP